MMALLKKPNCLMRKALYYAQALVVKSHRRRANECPWRETAHNPKIVIIAFMMLAAA